MHAQPSRARRGGPRAFAASNAAVLLLIIAVCLTDRGATGEKVLDGGSRPDFSASLAAQSNLVDRPGSSFLHDVDVQVSRQIELFLEGPFKSNAQT